ncbi:hypothetical protein GIB67_020562, partial [Kingdonia uniflora]
GPSLSRSATTTSKVHSRLRLKLIDLYYLRSLQGLQPLLLLTQIRFQSSYTPFELDLLPLQLSSFLLNPEAYSLHQPSSHSAHLFHPVESCQPGFF